MNFLLDGLRNFKKTFTYILLPPPNNLMRDVLLLCSCLIKQEYTQRRGKTDLSFEAGPSSALRTETTNSVKQGSTSTSFFLSVPLLLSSCYRKHISAEIDAFFFICSTILFLGTNSNFLKNLLNVMMNHQDA